VGLKQRNRNTRNAVIPNCVSGSHEAHSTEVVSNLSVARVVFSGKRGELRQRYREGQEDQLGAFGLVVNMIVLWNTIYIEAVLEQLRKEGYPVNEQDKGRLSPLIQEHINTQGRHSFMMPEAVVKGELRPLRNPTDDPD
jgi:Tn3 transposase DDE domain